MRDSNMVTQWEVFSLSSNFRKSSLVLALFISWFDMKYENICRIQKRVLSISAVILASVTVQYALGSVSKIQLIVQAYSNGKIALASYLGRIENHLAFGIHLVF